MENQQSSIVPKQDGYELTDNEKTIFFPTAELLQVGCRSCVWKLHGQCPHGLKGDEEKEEGICEEMIHFLGNLASKDDDISAIWEKFHIYKARLQESEDYKDFKQLQAKIEILEKTAKTSQDYEDLKKLRMDQTSAKIWWLKLNEHVVQSLQKVGDRSAKSTGPVKLPGIMSSGTINFNITEPKKQLENKKWIRKKMPNYTVIPGAGGIK